MMGNQRQLKITKLFRRGGAPKVPQDCEEIQQRIQESEEKLRALKDEWFQIQRQTYKRKISAPKQKPRDIFVRPQRIVLSNSVETMKRKLEVLTMLTGVEIQSFTKDDHCCIVYHMRHDSDHQIKHGLRIEMKTDGNEVTKSSLPEGFKLNTIVDDHDDIMKPEYLLAVQTGLLAYYDRLEQYEALKKLLTVNGTLFKVLDGSHLEITFSLQNVEDEEEKINVVLLLEYRVYDIRPKKYLMRADLPEDTLETLQQQCALFKKKPLAKAFKNIFINGTGVWKLVQQLGTRKERTQVRPKRHRPNKNPNNDDTFHPEECSDQGEDDYAE